MTSKADTLLQRCQDTEKGKAMMFKYNIDTRGKKEITKEMKEAEMKKLSFKAMVRNYCTQRHARCAGCNTA